MGVEACELGTIKAVQLRWKDIGESVSIIWKISDGKMKVEFAGFRGVKVLRFEMFLQNLRTLHPTRLVCGEYSIQTVSELSTVIMG